MDFLFFISPKSTNSLQLKIVVICKFSHIEMVSWYIIKLLSFLNRLYTLSFADLFSFFLLVSKDILHCMNNPETKTLTVLFTCKQMTWRLEQTSTTLPRLKILVDTYLYYPPQRWIIYKYKPQHQGEINTKNHLDYLLWVKWLIEYLCRERRLITWA